MKEKEQKAQTTRRDLLLRAGTIIGTAVISWTGNKTEAFTIGKPLSVGEDLMQEHGVLGRLILIYAELVDRLNKEEPDLDSCIGSSTKIIQKYIQEHHERVEEMMIFPVLRKADILSELVPILIAQHASGREVTESICNKLDSGSYKTEAGRNEIAKLLKSYIQMFRPHALREDTVVYPALHRLMSPDSYLNLSLKVQELENKMKPASLEEILKNIENIEVHLGINDLSKYTYRESNKSE